MNAVYRLSDRLNWLYTAALFFKKHFLVLVGLGLIAAFGRVIQLGGFGPISSWMNIVLEIVVESARILLFLYVLGLASIKNGALRIKRIFTEKNGRKAHWNQAVQVVKKQWVSILLNFAAFLIVAWVINYLIEVLAYETCLYLSLKKGGILADASSEWTVLLFFKNISVIPFALTFEAVFLLWVTNKFRNRLYGRL